MTRAVVLTIAALTVAACGGEGGGDGSTGASSSPRERGPAEGAFKFAECMREHGVTDFPDPEVDGNRVKLGGPGLNPNDPKMRAAQPKCQKHLEGGANDLSPADRAKMRDVGVKMAECMRANGVADFPDPQADGSIQIRRGQGPSPESATFQAAQRKCEHILEEARETLEGGGK